MEKDYQDYAYHLMRTKYWYRRIGLHQLAEIRHKAHLDWASSILKRYK